ncbi:MAG: flagellar basal body rod protein FlgF [Nevskia sp.]|nr:flagellar basal body rod protein FlgF [Nevskia sp.]
MDKALYISMSGAMQTMLAQSANSNNLANAGTTGFRAQMVQSQPVAVDGAGFGSRVNSQLLDQGWDSTQGDLNPTGRDLDVALRPSYWLAVQAPDGTEAYTRAGNLSVNANGQLITGNGQQVLGDAGPLSVPAYSSIKVGDDGTISIVPAGQNPNTVAAVGRLKVVQADQAQIARGSDGLMHPLQPDTPLDSASGTVLTSGKLEGSNVDIANTMVTMIQLARQFDLQSQLMKTVQTDASAASTLVQMS